MDLVESIIEKYKLTKFSSINHVLPEILFLVTSSDENNYLREWKNLSEYERMCYIEASRKIKLNGIDDPVVERFHLTRYSNRRYIPPSILFKILTDNNDNYLEEWKNLSNYERNNYIEASNKIKFN